MSLSSTSTTARSTATVSRAPLLFVANLARRTRPVVVDTPFSLLCELLRASPYRMLPVVDSSAEESDLYRPDRLIGVVTEKSIADALLFVGSDAERERLRRSGVTADVLFPITPEDCALPGETITDLCGRLDRLSKDAIPVIESRERPYYLGMVSRSDLVHDLLRPFQPPTIGGMATPLGVYLTDGARSAGVGTLALAATGFYTIGLHLIGAAVIVATTYATNRYAPGLIALTHRLPHPLTDSITSTFLLLLQFGLFLTLLRQTSLAGYHAAEHQVVHAIERGEPLLPEIVRAMPRVHPRCSTNLVAGMLIFFVIGTALTPGAGAEVAYLAGAFGAFLWWKPFGSWLQQYATTRPASDREIESGIRAAKELLSALDMRLDTALGRPMTPIALRLSRIWRMGFLQIFMGYGVAYALLVLLAYYWPALGRLLQQ